VDCEDRLEAVRSEFGGSVLTDEDRGSIMDIITKPGNEEGLL